MHMTHMTAKHTRASNLIQSMVQCTSNSPNDLLVLIHCGGIGWGSRGSDGDECQPSTAHSAKEQRWGGKGRARRYAVPPKYPLKWLGASSLMYLFTSDEEIPTPIPATNRAPMRNSSDGAKAMPNAPVQLHRSWRRQRARDVRIWKNSRMWHGICGWSSITIRGRSVTGYLCKREP